MIAASFSLPSIRTAEATRPQPSSTPVDPLVVSRDLLSSGSQQNAARSVPGEVIVKFRTEAAMERTMTASHTIADSQTPFSSSETDIEAILARYDVREARPVFPAAQRQKRAAVASAREAYDSLSRILKLVSTKKSEEVTRALMIELGQEPEVEYAVPNTIYEIAAAPNDPFYSSSGAWGQDYKDLWGLHNIEAEQAWDTTQGEGVVVAVIDTGVDYNHEDIAENIWNNAGEIGKDASGKDKSSNGKDDDGNGFVDDWRGWYFPDPGKSKENNKPMDNHAHGTHVAGTIAAVGNNGKGIIGVAPKARIMALKAFSEGGTGTVESAARAIVYAAENGARVINASFGGFSSGPQPLYEEILEFAVRVKGVVMAVAAGNFNSNVERGSRSPDKILFFSPAYSRRVITIAASDHLDQKADFSNFGSKIDVTAPGGGDQDPSGQIFRPIISILSLLSSKANPALLQNAKGLIFDKYIRLAGTSMAAPHTAGVAALILSKNPHFTPEQVRQAIRLGADDAGTPGFDPETGYGRINAARSVAIANPPAPTINSVEHSSNGAGLNVFSTITGQSFTRWRLEYGKAELGDIPSSWTEIASSTDNVNTDLKTLWNTGSVADGFYTLRLRVEDNEGRQLDDRTRVAIRDGRLVPLKFSFELDNFSSAVEPEDANRVKTLMRHTLEMELFYPSFDIAKVELYERGQRVGSFVRTASTYEALWTPGPVGETELTVVVEGKNGDKFISETKRVKIVPNAPPDLRLLSAGWPERQHGKDGFGVYMKLTDPDGKKGKQPTRSGLKVEVYNFDQFVGLGMPFPPAGVPSIRPDFHYHWEAMPAGTYSIRVVATDKDGQVTRLKPFNFTILPPE